MNEIPFNKPFIAGKELYNISQAVLSGHLAGNGPFSNKCREFLESRFRYRRVFMTHSGTGALEMAALLCRIQPGDEVVLPSYTFVSTANAFLLHGATLKFVDIRPDTLNLDEGKVEAEMSDKTKVICPVHYAGVGCEMEKLGFLSQKHDTLIIEDAAHAVNARFQDRFLGTFGGLAALSFHETKNYISGEGGALIVNDESMIERAEILWEKGTNRSKFFQGQVDKYTWVDIGSSFYPSELVSAFLFGQFEETETIMKKRMDLWDYYRDRLQDFEKRGKVRLPVIPAHCRHNAHMFYLLLNSEKERNDLLARFREKNIHAVFHYIPLHTSPMGRAMGYAEGDLPVSEDVSRRILRLPLFFELDRPGQDRVVEVIEEFFG